MLADALTEAGDPRGELIALQLAPQTPAIARKIAKLVKTHREHLLGTLAPVVGEVAFRRGFLSRATLAKGAANTLRDPLWATVEHLEGDPVDHALVEHSSLTSLRSLGLTEIAVAKLAKYDWLEELTVGTFFESSIFARQGNFPSLRALTLHLSYMHNCDTDFAQLVKNALVERLSAITVDATIGTGGWQGAHGFDEGDLELVPDWLNRLAKLHVAEVTLATRQGKVSTRYRFTPDAATVTIPRFPKRYAADLRATVAPMIEIVRQLRSTVQVIEP